MASINKNLPPKTTIPTQTSPTKDVGGEKKAGKTSGSKLSKVKNAFKKLSSPKAGGKAKTKTPAPTTLKPSSGPRKGVAPSTVANAPVSGKSGKEALDLVREGNGKSGVGYGDKLMAALGKEASAGVAELRDEAAKTELSSPFLKGMDDKKAAEFSKHLDTMLTSNDPVQVKDASAKLQKMCVEAEANVGAGDQDAVGEMRMAKGMLAGIAEQRGAETMAQVKQDIHLGNAEIALAKGDLAAAEKELALAREAAGPSRPEGLKAFSNDAAVQERADLADSLSRRIDDARMAQSDLALEMDKFMEQAADPKRLAGGAADGIADLDKNMAPMLKKLEAKLREPEQIPGEHKFLSDKWNQLQTTFVATSAIRENNQAIASETPDELQQRAGEFSKAVEEFRNNPLCPESLVTKLEASQKKLEDACVDKTVAPHLADLKNVNKGLDGIEEKLESSPKMAKDDRKALDKALDSHSGKLNASLRKLETERDALAKEIHDAKAGGKTPDPAAEKRLELMDRRLAAGRDVETGYSDSRSQIALLKRKGAIQERGKGDIVTRRSLANTEADIKAGTLEAKDRDALKAKLAGGKELSEDERKTIHTKLDAALTGKQKAALGDAFSGISDPDFTPTPEQAAALSQALERTFTPDEAGEMLGALKEFSAESRDAMLDEIKIKVAAAKTDNGALINLGPRLVDIENEAGRLLSAEDQKAVMDSLVSARDEIAPNAVELAVERGGDKARAAYDKLDAADKKAFGELCSRTLAAPGVGAGLLDSDDPSATLKALSKGGRDAVDALDKLMLSQPENDDLCLELKGMYNGLNAVPEEKLTLEHDSARTTRGVRTLLGELAGKKDVKPEDKKELDRLLALPDGEMYDLLIAHLGEDKIDSAPGNFSACDLMILRGAYENKLSSANAPKDFAEFQATLPKPYGDTEARPHLEAEVNSGFASSSKVSLAGGVLKATSKANFLNWQLRAALKDIALTPDKRAAEAIMQNKLTNLMGFKETKNKDVDTLLDEIKGDSGKLALDKNLAKPGIKNAILNGLQTAFKLKDKSAKLAFGDQLDAMQAKAGVSGKLASDVSEAKALDSAALNEVRGANGHLDTLEEMSKGIADKGKQFVVDGKVKADKLPNKTMTVSLTAMDSLTKTPENYGDWKSQQKVAGALQFPKHMNFATMQGSDSSGRFSSVKADTPEGREFRALRDKMTAAGSEEEFAKARDDMGKFLAEQNVGKKTAALLHAAPAKPGQGAKYIQERVGKALGKAGAGQAGMVAKQLMNEHYATIGKQKQFEELGKMAGKTQKAEGKELSKAEKATAKAISAHVADTLDDVAMVSVLKQFRDGKDGDFASVVAAAKTRPSLVREACVRDIKETLGCTSGVAEYALDHCLNEKIGGKTDLQALAKDNGLSIANRARAVKDLIGTPFSELTDRERGEIKDACHIMAESVGPGKAVAFDSELGIELGLSIPLDPGKVATVGIGFSLAAKNGLSIVGNADGSIELNLVNSLNAGVNANIDALKGFITANVGVDVEGGAGFSFSFVDDEKGTAKEKLERFTTDLFSGQAGVASFAHVSSVSTIVKAGGGLEAGAKIDATKLADAALNEVAIKPAKEMLGEVTDKLVDKMTPDFLKSGDSSGKEETEETKEKKVKPTAVLSGRVKAEASLTFSARGEGVWKHNPDGSKTWTLGFSAQGKAQFELGVEFGPAKKGLQKATGKSSVGAHAAWQAGGEVSRTMKNGKLTAASMSMSKEFKPGDVDSPDQAVAIAKGMGITNETLLKDLRTMVENKVPVTLTVQKSLRPSEMERMNREGFSEKELLDSEKYDTDGLSLTYDTANVKKEFKLGFGKAIKVGVHIQATGKSQETIPYSNRE